MAKPIFLVGINHKQYHECPESIDLMSDILSKQLFDYHVVIYSHIKEDIEFQAFHEKDFNEVKYEELKEIVRNSINKIENSDNSETNI
jgi:hypothetical protein